MSRAITKFKVSRKETATDVSKSSQKLATSVSVKAMKENNSTFSALSKNLIRVSRASHTQKQTLGKSLVMAGGSKESSRLEPSKNSPFHDLGSLDTESSERKPFDPKSQDNLHSEDVVGPCFDSRRPGLLPKLKSSKSLAKLKIVSEAKPDHSSRGASKDAKSLFFGNFRTPVIAPRQELRFWTRSDKLSLPKLELKQTPPAFLRLNVHQFG